LKYKFSWFYLIPIAAILLFGSYIYYFNITYTPLQISIIKVGGLIFGMGLLISIVAGRVDIREENDPGVRADKFLKQNFLETEDPDGSIENINSRFFFGYIGKHGHGISVFTRGGYAMERYVVMHCRTDPLRLGTKITNPTEAEILDPRTLIEGPFKMTADPTDDPILKKTPTQSAQPMISIDNSTKESEETELKPSGKQNKK